MALSDCQRCPRHSYTQNFIRQLRLRRTSFFWLRVVSVQWEMLIWFESKEKRKVNQVAEQVRIRYLSRAIR